MERQSDYPDYHNQPLRLTLEEMENPMSVIERFWDGRNLIGQREFLWEVFSTAFGGNAAEFYDGSEIGSWVFFHRQLEQLIEAAWMMHLKNEGQVIKKTNRNKRLGKG